MKVITVKLEEWMVQALEYLAYKHNLSRSDVIREALEQYIQRELPKHGGKYNALKKVKL